MAELKGKVESNELAIKVNIVGSGPRGANGKDGKDGYTPIKGVDYFDGRDGRDGRDGVDGSDYIITSADYAEIAALVPRYDDTELREMVDTKADKTVLDETNRDVEFLKLVTKDVNWTKEEREENGHATLPKGGLFGNVDEVRGKTEQETTNGYQLLRLISKLTEQTINGITYTPVYDNEKLLHINANGTATATSTYIVRSYSDLDLDVGTYYCLPSGFGFTEARCTYATNTKTCEASTAWATLEVNSSATKMYMQITTFSGFTLNNAKFYPMISKTANVPYEPYTGGLPMPNPDYPSEIVSVDSINILHTDADGNTLAEHTVIPPRPLNAIGDYKDKCNVVSGEWEWHSKQITEADYTHSVVREADYFLIPTQTEPIDTADLDYLRNLTLNRGDNLFITDNHGRDVSYLMSDFINLREALS